MAQSFADFITEQRKPDKEIYRAVVISHEHGGKGETAKRMESEAKKLGIQIYIVVLDGTYLFHDKGKTTIHAKDDDKGFEIHPDNTVVFMRGTPDRLSYLDLITQLERLGIPMVNSRLCLERASDKYRTYLRLKDFGLEQPKTVLVPSTDDMETSLEKLDSKFPLIMKTLQGSKGVGVLWVESERSMKALVQTLYKTNPDTDLLIQEYHKTDYDVRALVLNNTVIAAMRRDVVSGDFRSNASQGANVSSIELTKQEEIECIHAAKSIGGIFTGVDFIPAKNRETGRPIFLEVNSSPGTEGIEDATGKNISKILLEHFLDKNKRYTVPTECGWEEIVTVEHFGNLTAKFDTGNYKYPVLHADEVDINGKNVKFKAFGKTVTTRLIDNYISVTGGGEDERPVIEVEFEFAGTNYGKIHIGLDNRDRMGTDVLLNRKMMSRMNVIIDPQRTYLVTTPIEKELNNDST